MSSGPSSPSTPDVVDLNQFRGRGSRARGGDRRHQRLESDRKASRVGSAGRRTSARLLSMRQRLDCHGSVEIHGHSAARARNALLHPSEWDRVATEVRRLLEQEFGHLRVHRVRDAFAIRHHDREALVAGILRVQYVARQLLLGNSEREGVEARNQRILLNWGAGNSAAEADGERIRRRQGRQSRR